MISAAIIKELVAAGLSGDDLVAAVERIEATGKQPAANNSKLLPWPPPPPWPAVTADNLAESEARLAELEAERAGLDKRYRSSPTKPTLTLAEEERLHQLIRWCDQLAREIKPIKRLAAA
jgi:hypothetical protein